VFTRISKGYRRLYGSSSLAMLNQAAVNSKGESARFLYFKTPYIIMYTALCLTKQ